MASAKPWKIIYFTKTKSRSKCSRICVSVCVVFPILGCGCVIPEVTRHQTAFCCSLHLFWILCLFVSTIFISERIMPALCKLIVLSCAPGENYVLSCMKGGGKTARSWFRTLALYFCCHYWAFIAWAQAKTGMCGVVYSCWAVLGICTSGFPGPMWHRWNCSIVYMNVLQRLGVDSTALEGNF